MKPITQALKYLNSLPFPITVKHYVSLEHQGSPLKDGTLRSKESWQILRDEHPRYRIPKNRETWLEELSLKKDGQDVKLQERVKELGALIKREGIKTLYSIGSGGGVFEYYLKKQLPAIKIFASEPTVEGVERLKSVFIECDKVEVFDALNENDWKKIGEDPNGMVFLYRNEREFSNEDWRKIFKYMHSAGVKRVFLGLMNMLTFLALLQEKFRNIKLRLKGVPLTYVGDLRSRYTFRSFWYNMYRDQEINFPNGRGLYLKIIESK